MSIAPGSDAGMGYIDDSTQDGIVFIAPKSLSGVSSFGESEFHTWVQTLSGVGTTDRNLIKLLSVKILSYGGNPLFRKSSLFGNGYDRSITEYPEPDNPQNIFVVPHGQVEMFCPVFTLAASDTLELEICFRKTGATAAAAATPPA